MTRPEPPPGERATIAAVSLVGGAMLRVVDDAAAELGTERAADLRETVRRILHRWSCLATEELAREVAEAAEALETAEGRGQILAGLSSARVPVRRGY